jgi:hypothetical protein
MDIVVRAAIMATTTMISTMVNPDSFRMIILLGVGLYIFCAMLGGGEIGRDRSFPDGRPAGGIIYTTISNYYVKLKNTECTERI